LRLLNKAEILYRELTMREVFCMARLQYGRRVVREYGQNLYERKVGGQKTLKIRAVL
jgi:hypothetical protein